MAAEVTVYTREGCGLCRTAERLAAKEAGAHALVLVDIDGDPDLQRRYNIRVPVIAIDGVEVIEGHVEAGQVRRALRAAGHGGGWRDRFGRG